MRSLTIVLTFLAFTSFGKESYTIFKDEFKNQFQGSNSIQKIHCTNKDGAKVWLFYLNESTLQIVSDNNKKNELEFKSVHFENDTLIGLETNVYTGNKKKISLSFLKVVSITVNAKRTLEKPYYDYDSVCNIAHVKNDSMKSEYSKSNHFYISATIENKNTIDTFQILENACYNLVFKDNVETIYGVVYKITKDSIYISNYFNENPAKEDKKQFLKLGYLINDIARIKLLNGGGFSYKTFELSRSTLITIQKNLDPNNIPCFYKVNQLYGKLDLYRFWLTNNGYVGIKEDEGRIYWLEHQY